MKNLFLTVLAAGVAAICMTGCFSNLDDDQYHTLTASEKTQIINDVAGSYSGQFQYYDPVRMAIDSTETTWSVRTDSTVNLKFPVSYLKNYVDTLSYHKAYVALANAPAQALSLQVYVPTYVLTTYWEKYWEEGDYSLTILPSSKTLAFTIGEHSYTITYTYSNMTFYDQTYSPSFEYKEGEVEAFVLVESLEYDGYLRTIGAPVVFYGEKH